MEDAVKEKRPFFLWEFFSSVKLTIVLLIILAVASVVGTIIPQREGAMEFARTLSPEVFQFFSALNLFDIYHAFWFRVLIGLLALNLIVCSIDRFPGALNRIRSLPRPDREKPFENLPPSQTFLTGGSLEGISSSVGHFLRGGFKRTQIKKTEGKDFFLGEKGRYAHFGVYLVHLSVLVILIGAMIGSFLGFEAHVNILEGEKTDTVFLRNSRAPLKLGFQVQCDRFSVEFYKNGAPKEYRSELTFFSQGKEAETKTLLVNHPVHFNGVTFYQSSYGNSPGKKVLLKIVRTASPADTKTMEAAVGESLPLPGGEGEFRLTDVNGNLMGMMGPAALISIHPNQGEEVRFWIFQDLKMIEEKFPGLTAKDPRLNPSAFKPYTFFLEKVETRFYTGLQVNKDPGVFLVWIGCFLMVAGFFVTFFTSHRRVWIRVSEEKGGIRVSLAGTANKNPVGLQRELEHLGTTLRRRLEEGK